MLPVICPASCLGDRVPRFPIAMPIGHFMGLAPLDVWVRLLVACRCRIGPRYWLRLVAAMGTSLLATLITLPERLLLWPVLAARFRGRSPTFTPKRDAIVIVGYFRSGTTHLHNLLSTHPDVVTPRWVQAMSPQGFWLSWGFLRLALVPFLPNTRPQDDVGFGPDWPAEDDFAHNNWALASTLPGRLVLPQERARWTAFSTLAGLPDRDLSRWRRVMAAFAWKVSASSCGRRHLLLKSPSHTGKIAELDRLFAGRVRFVHISRDAGEVVRSNVAMHARLGGQSLQPLPRDEETREAVIREYVEAETRFQSEAAALPPDRVVRLGYHELVAAPAAAFARVCETTGLAWDERVRARAARYLAEVGAYESRAQDALGEPGDPRLEALDRMLALPEASHAVDAAGVGASNRPAGPPPRRSRWRGIAAVWVSATAGLGVWLLLAHLTESRLDMLAWPLGGLVGVAALRARGRGDAVLGAWAAVGALMLVAASVWPLPAVSSGWTGADRLNNLRTAYGTFNNNYLYLLFGMVTAYRYASRRFARPPGL